MSRTSLPRWEDRAMRIIVITIINLRANLVASHVHLLSPLVDAIFRATLCEQVLLGGIGHENIHIAFNLLCGGPINLAVLLQAILLRILCADCCFARSPASLVIVLAIHEQAGLMLTIAGLALCLLAVTFCILLDVDTV